MDNQSKTTFYEIPRKVLRPMPDPLNQLTTQVSNTINSQELDIIKNQLKVPFEAKIVNLLNNKKETIKSTLIPFIIGLLLEFGPSAAQSVINKTPNLSNFCPSSSKINTLINKRNSLVKQLNNLYSSITSINVLQKLTDILTKTLEIGIQVAKAIPYPSIGVPPIGLPPTTVGLQNTASDALQLLKDLLNKANVVIDMITIAIGTLGIFLGTIIDMLNKLDGLTQKCAGDQNMNLEQINNNINSLANTAIATSQTPEGNTYKGFKLEVVINEKNKSKFIQRYAQALTKQGVPVLKTDPSFASDPSVLISQLKFIIDSNPNLTAE